MLRTYHDDGIARTWHVGRPRSQQLALAIFSRDREEYRYHPHIKLEPVDPSVFVIAALVSPCSGRTTSLLQNNQAPRYGWRIMLFREQVAHTVLLDPRRNRGEPFTVILHPVRRRRFLPALTSYFVHSSGTSVRRGKTITSSSFVTFFLCRSSGTRQHLINQFVTVHFSNYRYCESVDLSKIEAGCRNMPSNKNRAAQSLHQVRRSAALLLLRYCLTYCITNRLISLQQEFSMLRLS